MNQRENHCHFQSVRWMAKLAALGCLLMPVLAKADSDKEQQRLKEAGDVIKDLLSKDRGIPLDVFGQGGMRDRSAFSEEGRIHHCRTVRQGSDDLPQRREFRRNVERPDHDGVERRQYWLPGGRAIDRLCRAGDE